MVAARARLGGAEEEAAGERPEGEWMRRGETGPPAVGAICIPDISPRGPSPDSCRIPLSCQERAAAGVGAGRPASPQEACAPSWGGWRVSEGCGRGWWPLTGQKMGRPANPFTRTASGSGNPQTSPFQLSGAFLLPRVTKGEGAERLPFSLRGSLLLHGEIWGHFLKEQGLFPRQAPTTFF